MATFASQKEMWFRSFQQKIKNNVFYKSEVEMVKDLGFIPGT